ncbi:MAG: hypothetical protein IV100_08520 [Myxococcales bacterium]|nr:hypothetical protein [Myxococcales bacterium]
MGALPSQLADESPAALRRFGVQTGLVFGVLFGLALPWLFADAPVAWPLWPWLLGGALVLLGVSAPTWLVPVRVGWFRLGLLLGAINAHLILGVLYFFVITPIGLGIRLLGKDPLGLRRDASRVTYRHPAPPRPRDHVERPF